MTIANLIRPELLTIKNYTLSGEHCSNRLHANELPWSPVNLEPVALNRYPSLKQQEALHNQVAACFNIEPNQLILTRGCDDAIDLLMRLFLRAGQDSMLQCPPTFAMYAFYAHLQQGQVLNCPLSSDNDFRLSLEQLISSWQANCKLIFLCQPNNPTGTLMELETIAKVCEYFKNKSVVVVDEAYIDFAEYNSATTLLSTFDNLIVLRTLSKAYGLAGLRLGALITGKDLSAIIRKTIPPYTLSSAVIELGLRALNNKTWFAEKVDCIIKERTSLIEQLTQSPWIEKIFPTRANFVLVASSYAEQLAAWFAEFDIAVRHFALNPLQHWLRITIGDAKQNQNLLSVLGYFKP